ncbi:MAG: 16S rRNA (cytosine(1402)-N(4))-methyltransferase [Spirochaetes bacterium GWF1_51_8]|nr:MAG: 16S rRNA (cytosine(1402)-N(4))-methyltransferase [Spirochaetes bacterium GWF1_51_8]
METGAPYFHTPIMLAEILEIAALKKDSFVIDCTCGEGGHSEKFAPLIPDGRLLCIDRDPSILEIAHARLSGFTNVGFMHTRFDRIGEIVRENEFPAPDFILADLGISMFHMKTPGRGISYTDTQSLDMRLDTSEKINALTVINTFKETEIADIIYKYGEEFEARKIAREIVRSRPFYNAADLADAVRKVKRHNKGRIHPATQTFQALRVYINRELDQLEAFLPEAVSVLKPGGRIVVMSFHSLEDRTVKLFFRETAKNELGTLVMKKPLVPSPREMRENPSARSTKLRAFEKRI